MTSARPQRRGLARRLVPIALAWLASGSAHGSGVVRVSAVDAEGHPVAGATLIEATRDADGRFRIDVTSPALGVFDERGVLTPVPAAASPTSRRAVVAPDRVAVLLAEDGEAETVRLERASPVVGRVADERGQPVGGVSLRALVLDDEVAARRLAFRVVPDATGAFALGVAPATPLRWFLERLDGRLERVDVSSSVVAGVTTLKTITVERGSTLLGRLIRLEGARPQAGLTVVLRPVSASGARADEPEVDPTSRTGAPRSPGAELADDASLVRATSDEGGRLRFFDVAPGVYEAELLDERYAFDGDAPRVDASGIATRRMETWWIERRATLVGRVVEGVSRAPVAGATVLLAPPADGPRLLQRATPSEVRTGADGRFRIEGIRPGPRYRLAVGAPGRTPVVSTLDVAAGVDDRVTDVLLLPARTVSVRVVDEAARPVAGAIVRVTPVSRPEPDPADPVSALFVRTATTDAAGDARIDDVAEGELLVTARHEGYVPSRLLTDDPGAGHERRERIELVRRASIEGVVRFADRPVDGVRVRGRGRSSLETREAVAGADGRFTLTDWGVEPVDVEAVSTSADRAGARSIVLARRESVLAGSTELVVLDVPALRRISGDVDGLGGAAGARVRLEVERYDPEVDDVRWSVVEEHALDVLGGHAAFEFLSIPPGRFAVRAIDGPRRTSPVDVLMDVGDVDGISILMPEAAHVSGRVLDGVRLQAALGARVRLVRLEGDAPSPGGESASTITRDDGAFAFDDAAPGRYRVEAADDGVATASTVVSVREGEAVFVPLRLGPGGSIEGHVGDADARPLASVPVRIARLPADEPLVRTRTDESGTFRSGPLAAGRYRLRVEGGRGLAAGLEADVEVVAESASVVDLSARGDAAIEGVVRRRGTPVPGLVVEARAADARGADSLTLRATADAYGQFRFPGLLEGTYGLFIVDGAVRGSTPVTLRAGDRVQRDLEVGEGRVSGSVKTARGDAVREADVVAVADPALLADVEGRVRTAPDGTFSIAGLPVGRYRLLITPPGRPTRIVEGAFADLAGQERPVDVVLDRGARLELTVKDDRRRAVAGAEVWIEDARGVALHPRALRTGPSGRLSVDGLSEGRARIRVRAAGYGRAGPQPVDLRDGLLTGAEVVVRPAGAIALTIRAGVDPRARTRVDLYRMPGRIAVEARRALRRPDECGCFGVTGRMGTLLLDDLEEGSYLVVATAGREFEELTLPVYVRAGETEPVLGQLRFVRR